MLHYCKKLAPSLTLKAKFQFKVSLSRQDLEYAEIAYARLENVRRLEPLLERVPRTVGSHPGLALGAVAVEEHASSHLERARAARDIQDRLARNVRQVT
jgi:hypothetical protein